MIVWQQAYGGYKQKNDGFVRKSLKFYHQMAYVKK